MAILACGEVKRKGKPEELVRELAGRVWRKTLAKSATLPPEFTVLSRRLISGCSQVHVLADASPAPGFEQIQPGLEDVYF